LLLAALLAAFSALLGGALALLAQRRPTLLELTRTFAFAAAGGVVVFHLLPEALPGLGPSALVWILAGYALPWLMELCARALGPGFFTGRGLSGQRLAAEVGFVALVFHSVVEGLALVSSLRAPQGRRELELALVAHHAPLTAAVILPLLQLLGARRAALRVVALALAGLSGVVLAGVVPALAEGADAVNLERATAVTAGILLHVVADEIRSQQFASKWTRAADLSACAAGLLLAGLSAVLHLRVPSEATPILPILRALCWLWLSSAPALFAVALAEGVFPRTGPPARLRLLLGEGLLTLVFLGPLFAILRGALAALLWVALPQGAAGPAEPPVVTTPVRALLLGLRPRAPFLLLLLVAAAAALAGAPQLSPGLSLHTCWPALLLLAAARADGAFATPLAAVLVWKGFSPGLAIALLSLGPLLRGSLRAKVVSTLVAAAAGALLVLALPAGLLVRAVSFDLLEEPIVAQLAASPVGALAGAAMLALVLATVWASGARGFFSPLRHRDPGPAQATLLPR